MPDRELNTVRAPDATSNPGLAVDAGGNPVIDPTKNVLDLVAAAIARQDDLREQQAKLAAAELSRIEEVAKTTFEAIRHEFESIEGRRVEQKVDTATAVSAALSAAEKAVREQAAAAKEAITKSENSAAEQSKLNAATFTAQIAAVVQSVQEVRDRIGKVETQAAAKRESGTDSRLNVGMIVGLVMGAVGILSLIIVLANFMSAGR